MTTVNPWVKTRPDPPKSSPQPNPARDSTGVAEAASPVVGSGLPVTTTSRTAALWFVGAHGGAGESTLARFRPDWAEAQHRWITNHSGVTRCLLIARSNVTGLLAAQAALTQWSTRSPDAGWDCVGLVLLADAPGQLPKPLRDLAQLVAGGAPRSWRLPWVEDWRTDPDAGLRAAPRAVRGTVEQLNKLAEGA